MLGMSFCAGTFCFLRINKFIFVCLIIIIHWMTFRSFYLKVYGFYFIYKQKFIAFT